MVYCGNQDLSMQTLAALKANPKIEQFLYVRALTTFFLTRHSPDSPSGQNSNAAVSLNVAVWTLRAS
jgi:hypothetical protein